MKSARNRGKKELLHPIFLECRDVCESEYWKGVFEDFAYGKYPKQIYISNHSIQSSNRKKFFTYSFRNKLPPQICKDSIELLTVHTDLISGEEIKQKKDHNEPFKKDVWACWKDIRKKYIKDTLLMEFCLRLRKDLSLSYKKTIHLYQKISSTVYTGQFTEIHIDNGTISSIDGLSFDEETQKFLFEELNEPKAEQIYATDDYVHHYCRRYMLRAVKLNQELLS